MSSSRPVVVHPGEGISGPARPETRRHIYDPQGRWVGWAGWIRNDAGDVSGWHHHADNDTYVYVIRGSVTIHFGPGGSDSVVARAGDFFIVPSQAIHRETTGQDADLEAFIFRVGGEPEHVSVDGPEAGGS
ncbi:MAG: cupin domain-containing protein [Chloroflexota bacterium]|nr:cupin domain-containing protein [Chloroflexota bacterium]